MLWTLIVLLLLFWLLGFAFDVAGGELPPSRTHQLLLAGPSWP